MPRPKIFRWLSTRNSSDPKKPKQNKKKQIRTQRKQKNIKHHPNTYFFWPSPPGSPPDVLRNGFCFNGSGKKNLSNTKKQFPRAQIFLRAFNKKKDRTPKNLSKTKKIGPDPDFSTGFPKKMARTKKSLSKTTKICQDPICSRGFQQKVARISKTLAKLKKTAQTKIFQMPFNKK